MNFDAVPEQMALTAAEELLYVVAPPVRRLQAITSAVEDRCLTQSRC
jgi:hypothetical protein